MFVHEHVPAAEGCSDDGSEYSDEAKDDSERHANRIDVVMSS